WARGSPARGWSPLPRAPAPARPGKKTSARPGCRQKWTHVVGVDRVARMSSNPPLQRAPDAAPPVRAVVRRPVVIPRRKPMRQARRVSLFEREIHVRLSPAAIEILFGAAGVLSEGLVDGDHYYG